MDTRNVSEMSVKALKAELRRHRISYAGITEKSELCGLVEIARRNKNCVQRNSHFNVTLPINQLIENMEMIVKGSHCSPCPFGNPETCLGLVYFLHDLNNSNKHFAIIISDTNDDEILNSRIRSCSFEERNTVDFKIARNNKESINWENGWPYIREMKYVFLGVEITTINLHTRKKFSLFVTWFSGLYTIPSIKEIYTSARHAMLENEFSTGNSV